MIIYFSNTPLFILDHTPQARYFGLMVLKSNLPQNDPPTKYFPKVQLSISYIKKKIHAFWTHPHHFPQKCFLVYDYILVPLIILDHPHHSRYFGLHDRSTHQIFTQSILWYRLHFSIFYHPPSSEVYHTCQLLVSWSPPAEAMIVYSLIGISVCLSPTYMSQFLL